MRFDVITLFPDMFNALSSHGVTRRALQNELFELHCWNPRDFTHDRHKTVDDRPYGGGPGMLMMYQPLKDTLLAVRDEVKSAKAQKPHVVYLSPQGQPLTQQRLERLREHSALTLVCGRYEGLDERFIEGYVDEEISIGDFVVSGGELPAMMLMDGLVRLLPGALGHSQSAEQDSFSDGLLDCPHYTRPEEIDGHRVPDVLLEGHHAKIDEWRHEQKLQRTQRKRPDLFQVYLNSQESDKP